MTNGSIGAERTCSTSAGLGAVRRPYILAGARRRTSPVTVPPAPGDDAHVKRLLAVLSVAAVALFGSIVSIPPAGAQASGTTLHGLTTDNRIVTFTAENPFFPSRSVAVTGLQPGEELIGIDRRPNNGLMYTVGKLGTAGRLYSVSTTSGVATLVAPLVQAPGQAGPGQPVVLSGDEFGFDFNPVPDALRIVSDTGQNLRVLPSARATGAAGATFADGTLNYAGTATTGVTAAAYTNSVSPAPASTTLYDIDTRRDRLVVQNPPNAGTLVDVGPLRFPTSKVTGFDIVGSGNTAYASLSLGSRSLSFLARVDLTSGRATVTGIAAFPRALRGLAA